MEDKMDRLRGKVILISGGARGQGAAEARLFVAEGARVVLGDVLEPEGRQLASELGDAATFLRQDVTQEGDWRTAVNAAEKLGGLHGLVNNAVPARYIDGDRYRAVRTSHARQSARLLSGHEDRGAIDGPVRGWLNRQYIICCRPPRISGRDRV